MSKLEDFISKLTDTELAIFIAYRYNGFISSSKQKIKDEASKRGLTTDKLTEIYNKGLSKPTDTKVSFCPRCYPTKLFIETDQELRTIKYYSYEVAVDTMRCRLCGYNPDKRKPKKLFDAIKQKFVNNKTVRIPKKDERIFKEL